MPSALTCLKPAQPEICHTIGMTIPAALARRRSYSGPALFSYGFRPFFLGAALWSAVGVLLWVRQYFGEIRSEEHTSELQSLRHLVCRLLLEKKKKTTT